MDGDTGNLTGAYRDCTFVMSHFSGARPLLLEVTLEDDGSLRLLQNRQRELTAVRSDSAAAAALPKPTDPSRHTTVADPDEPFRFSFPDLEGRLVTNEDARFAGEVVVVNITGSWCPNCHDEAPFLAELYDTYRDLGLAMGAWVEEDRAPERLVASKLDADGQVTLTRALCPYPQVAESDGSGDVNDEQSFRCVTAPTVDE